jgi:hypothetical protein
VDDHFENLLAEAQIHTQEATEIGQKVVTELMNDNNLLSI